MDIKKHLLNHFNKHNHKNSHEACVSVVPIFNHLEQKQIDEVMDLTKSINYKKGELIFRAGYKSDSLYIVSTGKIRIYRLSESGKEQLLRILKPGDFTGELALFRESIHENYAEAMIDTTVCTINRKDLQDLLQKYPAISLKILTEFSNRLEQSEKQTTRFATEKVETRLALYLAELVDEKSETMEVELPMTKKDLASYLGTTPETISRKLYELEDAGLIKQKQNRIIKIIDLEELLLI